MCKSNKTIDLDNQYIIQQYTAFETFFNHS